jgi:hypothetical protein
MVQKNLVAGFVAIFAMAAAGQEVAAQTPAPAPQTNVTASAVANFNDHAKGVVFQRNLERDVREEPLLIKQDKGRYLVHEPAGVFDFGEKFGKLKSYNQDELLKEHGPIENIRTYQQYKEDADILKKTPGLGRNLAENSFDMQTRLKDIESDMKKAGESFTLDQSQKIDQSYTTPVKKDMGMPPPING